MMLRTILFIALFLSLPNTTSAADDPWTWLRVEAGLPRPTIMEGHATTVGTTSDGWQLRLVNKDRGIDSFDVKIKKSGKKVIAQFEPPNTERVTLQLEGVFRSSALGDGSFHEEFFLVNTMNGNFMVLSRIRKGSK